MQIATLSTSNKREAGLERGRKRAAGIDAAAYVKSMEDAFDLTAKLFPTAVDVDFAEAIREFDAERLASQPSLALFPELNGHLDLLTAEREAFREATGLNEVAVAYAFSWHFYLSRRVSSQHVARYDLLPVQKACTNIIFPQGDEGVIIADNRDDIMQPGYQKTIPKHRPERLLRQNPLNWMQGGVSSAVLLDDEPDCLFPASPIEYGLLPDDCQDRIADICNFMARYREFWGPANFIFMDRSRRAVAVEKTNCLVSYRPPTEKGAIAVTACAYLDEKLHAHQMERTKRVAKLKGETEEESLDLHYHLGSRERYRRLVDLTNTEAKRGATLWGALDVVADRAVPYPARVCLAGERWSDDREPNANWSLTQHAAVISGDQKRCLYRSVQDLTNPRPVYHETPKLMLGPDTVMRPEWQADIAAGKCTLTPAAGKN